MITVVRETGIGIGKAGRGIGETGSVGEEAIQGAEAEAEIARIVMAMTVVRSIVVPVQKGEGRGLRMLGMNQKRRKKRRQKRMMEPTILILRLLNKTGLEHLWD